MAEYLDQAIGTHTGNLLELLDDFSIKSFKVLITAI